MAKLRQAAVVTAAEALAARTASASSQRSTGPALAASCFSGYQSPHMIVAVASRLGCGLCCGMALLCSQRGGHIHGSLPAVFVCLGWWARDWNLKRNLGDTVNGCSRRFVSCQIAIKSQYSAAWISRSTLGASEVELVLRPARPGVAANRFCVSAAALYVVRCPWTFV
jgi:hypothetical protein